MFSDCLNIQKIFFVRSKHMIDSLLWGIARGKQLWSHRLFFELLAYVWLWTQDTSTLTTDPISVRRRITLYILTRRTRSSLKLKSFSIKLYFLLFNVLLPSPSFTCINCLSTFTLYYRKFKNYNLIVLF